MAKSRPRNHSRIGKETKLTETGTRILDGTREGEINHSQSLYDDTHHLVLEYSLCWRGCHTRKIFFLKKVEHNTLNEIVNL
jgi:hypothetical protein